MKKYIYLFKEGSAEMSGLLGGKGANLAEMAKLKIPVPPGFTISTDACIYFIKHHKYPAGFKSQVLTALSQLEKTMNQKFGNNKNPLLLSVRSGAKESMPGMMETVLNIGLNSTTINGLIKKTNNERFVLDSFRRLITMYADVVMEKSNGLNFNIRNKLEKYLAQLKQRNKLSHDNELNSKQLNLLCKNYQKEIKQIFGVNFPNNSYIQLWESINAVFKSWNGERAKQYRKIENIPDEWGTAVNIQVMVFGNLSNKSGTGVAFTRNPSSGENTFYGEWLPNAQGEDVVAGIRTPYQIAGSKNSTLEKTMPKVYRELYNIQKKLEIHYKDMQDIEFTIEDGELWILQTRTGKRNGAASIKIALDLLTEKKINTKTALSRINFNHIDELLHPRLSPLDEKNAIPIASGLPAGPGAASGQIVFSPDKAETLHNQGYKVILVREETSPEDIRGMFAAEAILTARGGMTSHAALIARGWGKCCIVGCNTIALHKNMCMINGNKYKEMSWITLNGSTGNIYGTQLSLVKVNLNKNDTFKILMNLCKKNNTMIVRANADNAKDALNAKNLYARGIGLCRTEHMFFNPKRIREVRKMIIATSLKDKKNALKKILKFQTKDFYEILKSMSPNPVTIRLLDPPLHEFLPYKQSQIQEIANDLNLSITEIKHRIESLSEINPMLGHRGCRLGITFPELTEMQTKAIMEAANQLFVQGIKTKPEIMIPFISTPEEFIHQRNIITQAAKSINNKYGNDIKYLIGTMIELPRTCFIIDQIADIVDFISFGTNDLTQTTFGFSRDDVGSFLPYYLKHNIIQDDPFATLDTVGVGQLIKTAVKKARNINPKIKIGICGEHGGDPKSIQFFKQLKFNYVSCSPFRVPIAYLSVAKNNS